MNDVFLLTRSGLIKNIEYIKKEFLRNGMRCEILTSPRSAISKVKECFSLDYNHVPKLRALKVADFCVDPDTHRAKKGSYSTRLRKKEFELLRFFLSNKNIVLSRNTILSNVWGDHPPNPFTNTVDVHVAALRRKLRPEGPKIFKTVHGIGYSLQV